MTLIDEWCNACGGVFEPGSPDSIVPMFRCVDCGREVPSGAFPTTPEGLVAEAHRRYAPIKTFCLFSGGGDSTVLAHYCRDLYDDLVFIDTGTAIPGVVAHVKATALFIGKPLRIYAAGDAWRRMVVGGEKKDGTWEDGQGFPGPGQHNKAYTRLKERQIDALLRDAKVGAHRNDKVLFLTGVRRAESSRRAERDPITKMRAKVFCNPLIDWTDEQMRAYRAEHALPLSDIAALIHQSGECNCGAFAAPGEREMKQGLWPEWFDATIGCLEREAKALGLPCVWGERPPGKRPLAAVDPGALCSSCDWRQEQMDLAA